MRTGNSHALVRGVRKSCGIIDTKTQSQWGYKLRPFVYSCRIFGKYKHIDIKIGILMKKINENTKVTLTLGQIKKLVKESTSEFKNIDEVEIGDIGHDYYGMPGVVTRIGSVADFGMDEAMDTLDLPPDYPAVEIQYFQNGEKVPFVYDDSGFLVPIDWGNIKNVR